MILHPDAKATWARLMALPYDQRLRASHNTICSLCGWFETERSRDADKFYRQLNHEMGLESKPEASA